MFHLKQETQSEVKLDAEWLELILMAKGLGLSPDEIRDFLHRSSSNIAAS